MKKILIALLLSLGLTACSGQSGSDTKEIKVGASPVPHTEILEFIKEDLESQNIEMEIVEFDDYLTPNLALDDGSIDANFFQHEPYMVDNAQTNKLEIVSLGPVHIEPLALYSDDYDSIEDIPQGGLIIIPNDPTNCARALMLLDKYDLIELEDPTDINATEQDIKSNPNNYQFNALEAAAIPSALQDCDAAVINSNYALGHGLVPTEDGLIIEDKDNPFANIVAVRKGEENNEEFQILIDTLQSEKVKQYIEEEYQGEIIPAF